MRPGKEISFQDNEREEKEGTREMTGNGVKKGISRI